VLPPLALAVAWVMVMMTLPRLLSPSTTGGPEGLALPAVQAYMPDYAPGAGPKAGSSSAGRPAVAGSGKLAAPAGDAGRNPAGSSVPADTALGSGQPSISLVAAASGPARPGPARSRAGGAPVPKLNATLTAPPVTVVAAASPESPISLIPTVVTTPALDTPIRPQLIPTDTDATAPTPTAPAASKPKPKPDNPKAVRPNADKPKAGKAKAGRLSGTDAQRREPGRNGKASERKAQRPETVVPARGRAEPERPTRTRSPRPRIFTA
jgi:hypothetical protein